MADVLPKITSKEFSLDSIIRYFIGGVVLLACWAIAFPDILESDVISKFGAAGLATLALSVGILSYGVYRAAIYPLLLCIHALWPGSSPSKFRSGHEDAASQYPSFEHRLRKEYGMSIFEADIISGQITRELGPSDQAEFSRTFAAEAHLLYLSGFTAITLGILGWFFTKAETAILSLAGLVIFCLGIFHHARFRRTRQIVLKWISEKDQDKWLAAHGYKKVL
ncbi:MAG: hypothetical protein KF784_10195 [Fimbriimonadaceae bacterium]|nr:hypothetical protein [Fimbriimonadaceae bacterium]